MSNYLNREIQRTIAKILDEAIDESTMSDSDRQSMILAFSEKIADVNNNQTAGGFDNFFNIEVYRKVV